MEEEGVTSGPSSRPAERRARKLPMTFSSSTSMDSKWRATATASSEGGASERTGTP